MHVHELRAVAQTHAQGQLGRVFRPTLGDGDPANPVFALEFRFFAMDARADYIMNLIVHVLNWWIAYVLIDSLLHNRRSDGWRRFYSPAAWSATARTLMFAGGGLESPHGRRAAVGPGGSRAADLR